jgi:hypothetical protein
MTSPSQQKLRVVGPTVVTANRLSDGKVLYRAADEGWTTRLEAAAVVTTTEAARELLAGAVREDTEAVDAYAAPVAICDGCIEPGNLRERIRAAARHWWVVAREVRSQCPRGVKIGQPGEDSGIDTPRAFRRNDHRSIVPLTAAIVLPSHVPHLQWTARCGAARLDSIHVKF